MKNNSPKSVKFLALFSVFTLLLVICIPFLPLSGEEKVYSDTVRLHILANSDSEADQELKILVRDRVLSVVSPLLEGCNDYSTACIIIEDNKDILIAEAEKTLRENRCSDTVSFEFGKEYYPERRYEGVTLPAWTYTSVRLILGKGEGHNWWCILFPTLCTGSAKPEKELSSAGFTPEQIRILTENENPRYKVKFKIVEFVEKIFS